VDFGAKLFMAGSSAESEAAADSRLEDFVPVQSVFGALVNKISPILVVNDLFLTGA
jgi:hypothetical protein